MAKPTKPLTLSDNVSHNLMRAMLDLGWNRDDVAKKFGVSKNYIYKHVWNPYKK